MEDFSLNLLCRGKSHRLFSTLDSLKNQSGSFEVLLLDGEGAGRLQDLPSQYEGLKMRVACGKGKNLAQMMNLGLQESQGKYVQFLEPGEMYISQGGLSHLTELIQNNPLVIKARKVGEEDESHWFLRAKLLELGGFNENIHFRPMFDLLCRFQKEGIKPFPCSRVLVDGQSESGNSLFETCKILYRHFGAKVTLKWLFQAHFRTLRCFLTFFKSAFWRE
jgi:hypothetical protein